MRTRWRKWKIKKPYILRVVRDRRENMESYVEMKGIVRKEIGNWIGKLGKNKEIEEMLREKVIVLA